MIKLLELFGGIGACSAALKRLKISFEVVDYVEIDKFAVKSYNAINGTDFETQDITEWDKDVECDLIMHGSPCQDFSVAGKGAGGDKDSGTRSSLMYETIRIVEKLRPKYIIWENVKGVLSKRHKHNFDAYQNKMAELGYTNYYQVLNAKDYGVPQNRERVFTVSILDGGDFEFTEPMPLDKKLKDILEDNVDEKYYLDDDRIKNYLRDFGSKGKELDVNSCSPTMTAAMGNGGGNVSIVKVNRLGGIYDKGDKKHQAGSIYDKNGLCGTLSTMQGGNQEPIIVASRGRNPDNPSCRDAGIKLEQRLGSRKDSLTNTITSVQKDNYVDNGVRIRKLTPKECWRLMGFDDVDFEKAEKVNSDTQMYKQAGNSIVVNVLEAILTNLIKENNE